MKIAAIVGVKDERDLIQPCLERLWAVGVGPILVLDDHSTDGTLDVVERLAGQSPAPLSCATFGMDFDHNLRLESQVFGPFLRQHSPDWLLFIDADEFLVCVNDDLTSILADTVDPVLSVARLNVPLTNAPFTPVTGATAADFLRLPVITRPQELNQSLLDANSGRRWIMNRVQPKLLCRPDQATQYDLGWHSVADARGQPIQATDARGIVLIHLPLTTKDRFVRKVENAREFLQRRANHFPGENAWHWKRWIGLADQGLLDAEFDAQRMDDATLERLAADGVIERADDVLRKMMRSDEQHRSPWAGSTDERIVRSLACSPVREQASGRNARPAITEPMEAGQPSGARAMDTPSHAEPPFHQKPDRKVFCVGFNKTGTTSVRVALEQLGYRVGSQAEAETFLLDWARRDFTRIIDYCKRAEGFQDVPFSLPFTYQALDAAFPGSKFVLTVRSSSDVWYRSLATFHARLFGGGKVPTEEDLARGEYRWKGWILLFMRSVFSYPEGDPYNEACLVRAYESHNAAVQEYFRHRPESLLTLDLAADDSYEQFCRFLGTVPDARVFPWRNRGL